MPAAKIKERGDAAAQVSIGESACKPDDQTAIRYLIPLRPSGDFAAETNERGSSFQRPGSFDREGI